MAARTRRTTLSDEWRQRIQTSMIINRLQDHLNGKVELTPTQVRSAEILLRKTAPDLSATEMTIDDRRDVEDFSSKELAQILRQKIAGKPKAAEKTTSGETLN